MKTRLPIALVIGMVLVACDWLPVADGPDIDGAWELVRGTHDGADIVVPDGARITLTITGDELSGTSACNQYGGSFERDGNSISIGPISMTEMACEEPIMAAESAYLAALGDVDTVEPGRSLWLTGPATDLQFQLVPPVDDAAIVGTTWVLDSLISADAVSSVMGDAATLTLTADGVIDGSTGCRSFSGAYELSGDEIRVSRLVTDDRACLDGIADQDDHVLSVIGDAFTAVVDGTRLTLTSGADGLGYTAEP